MRAKEILTENTLDAAKIADIAQHMLNRYRGLRYTARERAVDHAFGYDRNQPQHQYWLAVADEISRLEKNDKGVAEDTIDEGVNDPHIFKAIAMIGPMGAGKSTIARQLVGGSGLRSLNLDNFNELLIKQGKVVGGNLTPDQLERNWELTQKQKGNWVSERLGLLIDGSGRNIEGLVKPLNELEQLGYDTMVILVNVSLETSIQRQQSRAAQQAAQFGQGRNVPLDLAKSSYQQIQQNIPKLKQLYGNRLLIINNEGAVDLSQEKTIVDRFMAAPPSKPAAVEWIKAHGQSQGQKIDKQLAQQQRQQASAQRAQTHQGVAEDTVDEMALASYKTLGDFSKPGSFRGVDKRLVPHPKSELKAAKFFEQTPYDFRLFFANKRGIDIYGEYGPMSPEEIVKVFGEEDAKKILDNHDDAITVVFVSNSGAEKVMMTPWIMAHRFGHAVYAGARRDKWSAWQETEKLFFSTVNRLLEEHYGKVDNGPVADMRRPKSEQLKFNLRPEYNALFNAIGTQRSSRTGQIRRPYEFMYELFAQYLGTGTITLNPLPTNLGYGRKVFGNPSKYLKIKPEFSDETERRQISEMLARDMELMFNDVLGNSVGKVYVM